MKKLLVAAVAAVGGLLAYRRYAAQRAEQDLAVSASDPGWHHPSPVVTGLLMAAGWVVLAACVLAATRRQGTPAQGTAPSRAAT